MRAPPEVIMDRHIDERAGPFRAQRHTHMRRTIARRLTESKATIPHFYLSADIAMERLLAQRARYNATAETKVSVNDVVVWCVARALTEHPLLNASWQEDCIRFYESANIGVAMAVEGGLVVPVVRGAHAKPLEAIAADIRAFAQKAKDRKLQPFDWEGNTFTVTNLGMHGVDSFTAIINPPDSAILAAGAIREMPVVREGAIVPGQVMNLTLCCDHRVVDGAAGALFLKRLRALLESAELPLLVEETNQ
jgi:pyruvate dehydrogenase E2 component (dihydrolipoamide acetyltransferase)